MVIIEISYKKSLSEVEKHLKEHINFLEHYYEKNIFIASGRKNPRDGGIILAHADKATLSETIKEDPFYQQGIAEYRLIEFEPSRHNAAFLSVINSAAH